MGEVENDFAGAMGDDSQVAVGSVGDLRRDVKLEILLVGCVAVVGHVVCCLVVCSFEFFFVANDEVEVFAKASTCGDEVTDDDVFFHALEEVLTSVDGGLGEDFGGFLEGCSGDEALGL